MPVETLCDGGAGVNSVTEEIVTGAINHAHSQGIYSKDPRYPVVQLERWDRQERVTGIASGHHVQIIGAVVLRVQMTELGKDTGPIIWVRCKIFKAGQSDWHGLILGGRALDSPMTGGLGHRPTPKGHAFEALGIIMERGEDIKANRYSSEEAYRMQLEVEPAPGVYAGEVRPSLLDIDDSKARGPEARAASSQPAPDAIHFSCANDKPVVEAKCDYWEETDDAWVRHHAVPRKAAFTPVGVRGAPSVESLKVERTTIVRDPETKVELKRVQDRWKNQRPVTDGRTSMQAQAALGSAVLGR